MTAGSHISIGMTQASDLYELVATFERYLFDHDIRFNQVTQGDDDYKYVINFGAYGLNVFIRGVSEKATLIISPQLKDRDKQSMLFPITEFNDYPAELEKIIRGVVSNALKRLDQYNDMLNQFSKIVGDQCERDGHLLEEGYNLVKRQNGTQHLIYYFNILFINRFGRENRLSFLFDFSTQGYESKSRINDQEHVAICKEENLGDCMAKMTTEFDKLYSQIWVSPDLYEQIIENPKAFGDNILPFLPKKKLSRSGM